jgi:hypothetical protein
VARDINLTLQRFRGLNAKYCPGQRSFKFVVPISTFITVWCTEAGNMNN